MTTYQVTDERFKKYGRIIRDIDCTELMKEMKQTPVPKDVVYVPSVGELEALPVFEELKAKAYGELPIQIGYCNGHNKQLNAVEYHRSSEVNVAVTPLVLLLGWQQDIESDFTYDSAKVEAFLVPAGTAVEVYATSLHYAPCHVEDSGFQCVVVLPKDTNQPLEAVHGGNEEDKLLTAKNKWLIAHPDAKIEGAFHGIKGENITL
ncbi:DUF4867 family protein [Lachnospiraceae bacterium ZAX-1]